MNILEKKENILFLILGGFFVSNAIIAEFIGVKIFSLENTLGFDSFSYTVFGELMSFNLTAGVVIWPVVFIMTDIINEYFGIKGVRFPVIFSSGTHKLCFLDCHFCNSFIPCNLVGKKCYFRGST